MADSLLVSTLPTVLQFPFDEPRAHSGLQAVGETGIVDVLPQMTFLVDRYQSGDGIQGLAGILFG